MQIVNRQIICVVDGEYVSYYKGSLYLSRDLMHFEKICDIPISTKQRVLSSFSFFSRLFRMYPRAVCVLDNNKFIFGLLGCIYRVDIKKRNVTIEHRFPSPMKTPLAFTKIENVDGFDDCILYGEYHSNPNKHDMGVYARINGEWKLVYSFQADRVLHIHGFCVDKANSRVLILTGDSDNESGIYEAKNNFSNIRPLLTGSQKYRSCVAFADGSSVIFATDTPLERNAIYRINKDVSVDKIFDMPGPSIFGTTFEKNGEKMYVFSTSVEPDSRIKGKKYWLTRKLGPGVTERYSHIVVGNVEKGFKTVMRLKKDILPMTAFQFGNASFAESSGKKLLIIPQSIVGLNGKTIIF